MKSFLIALFIAGAGFCQMSSHLEAHYVGLVTEVKLLEINDLENIHLWVLSDKEYVVKGVKRIPSIYVGDSLFEYWLNYQKIGVGTRKNLVIYQIN